jgi:hypothetical protein
MGCVLHSSVEATWCFINVGLTCAGGPHTLGLPYVPSGVSHLLLPMICNHLDLILCVEFGVIFNIGKNTFIDLQNYSGLVLTAMKLLLTSSQPLAQNCVRLIKLG